MVEALFVANSRNEAHAMIKALVETNNFDALERLPFSQIEAVLPLGYFKPGRSLENLEYTPPGWFKGMPYLWFKGVTLSPDEKAALQQYFDSTAPDRERQALLTTPALKTWSVLAKKFEAEAEVLAKKFEAEAEAQNQARLQPAASADAAFKNTWGIPTQPSDKK